MLVDGRPRSYCRRGWSGRRGGGGHEHLRRRGAVTERSMRAHRVVVAPPALDHHLGLAQAVEDLAVEQLVAEPGVEALDEAVLPSTAELSIRSRRDQGHGGGPEGGSPERCRRSWHPPR